MFVLVLTGLVVTVVGWGCLFVLVLTGLVVAVVGWGCYVCSGFDWFGCCSRGVGCLGCVWYGFVSFVDDRLVFLSSLQRYSFSAILSPCFSPAGGRVCGHRPHLNALALILIPVRLCPRRGIDLALTH